MSRGDVIRWMKSGGDSLPCLEMARMAIDPDVVTIAFYRAQLRAVEEATGTISGPQFGNHSENVARLILLTV
jgi:hypothetical protein